MGRERGKGGGGATSSKSWDTCLWICVQWRDYQHIQNSLAGFLFIWGGASCAVWRPVLLCAFVLLRQKKRAAGEK